jgi:2-polyprenyl-6-methoxyphenol hydroxylase-like FAD-dependent oxidoreductase
VSGVTVGAGAVSEIRFARDGHDQRVTCRLVIGADGRTSPVRHQLGIDLQRTESTTLGRGLLVDGVRGWPSDTATLGTEGDVHFFVFPRHGGRSRLYLLYSARQPHRFTGDHGVRSFLDAFCLHALPEGGEALARSRPAGPCAAYPMHDTWTDEPYVPGAILIGDAAGYNDPIIGQGLAIALRDARTVAELLIASDDWSPAALRPYAAERAERMRRLRFTAALATHLRTTFSSDGRRRRRRFHDLSLAGDEITLPMAATVVGPDALPAQAFEPETAAQVLALR